LVSVWSGLDRDSIYYKCRYDNVQFNKEKKKEMNLKICIKCGEELQKDCKCDKGMLVMQKILEDCNKDSYKFDYEE
jgi:hypothetical protein